MSRCARGRPRIGASNARREARTLDARPGRSTHRPRRQVWVGERSWDQRGPFALSDRDAAEIYGKVVFWEGANADLSARAGGDFADLEVSAPEDWLRKPSSISLFPSGRCAATRAYLAAEIAKRVEDRSTRVDALRSGDAALSASDSARLIVDKWLRFCDAAAERVDARRREVTASLRARPRVDAVFGVHQQYLPREGPGAASSRSIGRGDELVAYPDWAPQARPGAVAEVYCAKNASVRCKLRVDVLRRLLDRFLAAKLGSARAVPAATLDDANDEAEAALTARPGRVPKRKRPKARGDGDDERPPAFLSKVFSMLLRYDDLAGDAGQHGAIPAAVFDVLRRWGCDAECCATPFNATLGSYCSPFRDTDAPFGSVGSFFAFEPASGCYEINPPFTLNSDVVERHLRALLDAADRGGRPLMFVMVHAAAHARHARDGATRVLPVDRAPLRERSERRSSGHREPRERPALAGARRPVRALRPPRLPARRGGAPLPRGQVLRPGPAPRLRAADAVHRALPRDGRGRAAVAGDARAPGRHRGRVRLAAAAASGWRGGAGGAGAALIAMLAVASTVADSLDNAKLDQAPRSPMPQSCPASVVPRPVRLRPTARATPGLM